MKAMMKTTVLATSLILALTACSDKKKSKKTDEPKKIEVTVPAEGTTPNAVNSDSSSQVQVKVDEQLVVESSELTDAGEQLIGPYTFMLADKVFDSALAADPNNKKAQFYKSFLKRMMVFKGIAKRIRPFTRQQGNITELERQITEFPNSPLKNFLLDGKEDIKSVSDIINVIAEYKNALNDFRKFTKTNVGLELVLNLNPHIFREEIERQATQNCDVVQSESKGYTVRCDYLTAAQKKINSADMVALSQMAGGELVMWSLYTAYDITTLNQLSLDYNFQSKSPQEQLAYIKTLPSVAKLRKDQTLSIIPELGADISAAMKWAVRYQRDLCPHGSESSALNRPGHLIGNGICISNATETQKAAAQLDQMLNGTFNTPAYNEKGEAIGNIRIDLMGFLRNPPQDLKHLLPKAVNDKGDVTELGDDKTFGGLFPDGIPGTTQLGK